MGRKKKIIKRVVNKAVRSAVKRHRASKQLLNSVKTVGDQALMETFVDNAQFVNTTNALANSFWWLSNCVATPNVAASTRPNLCIDLGQHLLDMFSNQKISANNSLNGNNLKLVRKSAEVQLKLVNAQASPVELYEYRIMARHDQSIQPGALLYLQGNTATAAVDGISSDTTYVTNVYPKVLSVTGGGYPVPVGTTPFMLHAFVQQYKVLKVKKHFIMPGKWKKITYRQRKPRAFTVQQILNTNVGTNTIAGGTPWIVRKGQTLSLFAAKGTWATDASANATYKVGLSNINIGMEYAYRYHYGWHQSNWSATGTNQSIPGFSANAGNVPLPVVANYPVLAIGTGVGGSVGGTPWYRNVTPAVAAADENQMDV